MGPAALTRFLRLCVRRARLRAEGGWILIEAMATAGLLIVAGLGVFAAFDGAAATSGTDRARAIGSGVAQQDQERLRGFRAVQLSNYRETRTQTVAGVPYTVVSRGDWVTDSSGTASCTSSDARADYIKISSSVTWPAMHLAKPVVISSLVAPPNGTFASDQGTLAVQVRDRAGNPKPGTTVSVSGPESFTEVTNSQGCVIWGFLTAGNYTVSLAGSTCVDRQGVNPASRLASVIAETTNVVAIDCDTPGRIDATFDTKPVGASAPIASKARYLTVANSGLNSPGTRVFGAGTLQTTFSATSLFPFTDAYNVYSGNCLGANPTLYGQTLSPSPGGQIVGPGGSYDVVVRQPAVNVKVTYPNSNNPANGARVRATATASGCGGIVDMGTTNSQGVLADPGLPYGTYDICADINNRRATVSNVQNNNPNGTAQIPVSIQSGSQTGTCP
jgi:hypothetical protein